MGDDEQQAMANLHHSIHPLLTTSHNCLAPLPPTPDVCPTSLPTPCTAGVLTCPLGVLVVRLRFNVGHQLLLLVAHVHPPVLHDLLLDASTMAQTRDKHTVVASSWDWIELACTNTETVQFRPNRLHCCCFFTTYE